MDNRAAGFWLRRKKGTAMSFPATESDVLAIAADWLSHGHRVALATVVKTTGSAPRQDGSHIVVRDDGAFAGSVSAGCVEGAIIQAAQAVLEDGRHRGLSFGTSKAGVFESGLLCGGEIEILVEPIL
jgi:xanthine dehydrogenase accessory factor